MSYVSGNRDFNCYSGWMHLNRANGVSGLPHCHYSFALWLFHVDDFRIRQVHTERPTLERACIVNLKKWDEHTIHTLNLPPAQCGRQQQKIMTKVFPLIVELSIDQQWQFVTFFELAPLDYCDGISQLKREIGMAAVPNNVVMFKFCMRKTTEMHSCTASHTYMCHRFQPARAPKTISFPHHSQCVALEPVPFHWNASSSAWHRTHFYGRTAHFLLLADIVFSWAHDECAVCRRKKLHMLCNANIVAKVLMDWAHFWIQSGRAAGSWEWRRGARKSRWTHNVLLA